MLKQILGGIFAVIFLATIPLANYSLLHWGSICTNHDGCLIPVWPKPVIYAASSVAFVGLNFVLRDLVQRSLGLAWAIICIILGAVISYLIVSPTIATASTITFLVSESANTLVYTPLQKRHFMLAVILSAVAGCVIDSALFILLAFHDFTYLPGMIIGKIWSVIICIPLISWLRVKIKF